MKNTLIYSATLLLSITTFFSCRSKSSDTPSLELINSIQLKKGKTVSCGPATNQFGNVNFEMSCDQTVREDFNLAMEMLHSFEYDESEKVFASIIDKSPGCPMAYWGVAMSNFHPLWTPPTEAELKKGSKAVEIARSISNKTERESAYIEAIGTFYKDWDKVDHMTRCRNFKDAMEKLHATYPNDMDASTYYALSLVAASSPNDKTYTNQLKAGEILNALYPGQPDHPGIVHYIIHTYDYPGLATKGLSAARSYAAVAPSSAHALHMPSHIFTRLGYWEESIQSNLASVEAAKCYAEQAGLKGQYDEEYHGTDYLVYAYLQQGKNDAAVAILNYLNKVAEKDYPLNFKVAYSLAAIPARIAMENKDWKAAANLQVLPANFPWKDFPWQEGIIHFTRGMGAVHTGDKAAAADELRKLKQLQAKLEQLKDAYKTKQVEVQVKAVEAWMRFKENKNDEAIALMRQSAAIEDSSGKHPVTPGEIIPARELLGDMLLGMNKPAEALVEYEKALEKSPNRKNALIGAGKAAELLKDLGKAKKYHDLLAMQTKSG